MESTYVRLKRRPTPPKGPASWACPGHQFGSTITVRLLIPIASYCRTQDFLAELRLRPARERKVIKILIIYWFSFVRQHSRSIIAIVQAPHILTFIFNDFVVEAVKVYWISSLCSSPFIVAKVNRKPKRALSHSEEKRKPGSRTERMPSPKTG